MYLVLKRLYIYLIISSFFFKNSYFCMVSLLLSPCTGVFEQPCKLIKHGGRRIHEDTRYFRTCQQGKDSLRGEIWM